MYETEGKGKYVGCSSAGRAPDRGSGGRGFKSRQSPHGSVVQLVSASDCRSEDRGFESRQSRHMPLQLGWIERPPPKRKAARSSRAKGAITASYIGSTPGFDPDGSGSTPLAAAICPNRPTGQGSGPLSRMLAVRIRFGVPYRSVVQG